MKEKLRRSTESMHRQNFERGYLRPMCVNLLLNDLITPKESAPQRKEKMNAKLGQSPQLK